MSTDSHEGIDQSRGPSVQGAFIVAFLARGLGQVRCTLPMDCT